MKKLFLAAIVFTLYLFASSDSVIHASFQNTTEKIDSFTVQMRVDPNGTIKVTETILYNFGSYERHGIFRDIQNTFVNQDGVRYKTLIKILGVTDEKNTPYRYATTQKDNNLSIKIGDPNKTITGKHTYVVKYSLAGAIESFSDHDEIYHNVTGNGWNIPIDSATVDIFLPSAIPTDSLNLACYTGAYGSKETNCTFSKTPQGTITYQTTKPLWSNEGISVVLGFEKGYIAVTPKQEVKTPQGFLDKHSMLAAFGLFIWYIALPAGAIVYYLKYGRDPKLSVASIPPLFEPPLDKEQRLPPGEVGTILDESADNKEITATLVDLAIRGHMKISEDKEDSRLIKALGAKNYIFTKSDAWKTKDKHPLQPHEEKLLSVLFSKKITADADDLASEMALASKEIKESPAKVPLVVNTKDLKGKFAAGSEKVKDQLYSACVKKGFFPHNPKNVRSIWTTVGILALMTVNAPFGITSLILARAMPRKTTRGATVQRDALGLKKFLTSQEKQLEFQEKNWYLFEKLLPYAVAFGVTKTWAKRFADVIKPVEADWYEGATAFNYAVFATAIANLGSTVSSAATPTRSSSGFGSGFSGGGFSGGGGGGSW